MIGDTLAHMTGEFRVGEIRCELFQILFDHPPPAIRWLTMEIPLVERLEGDGASEVAISHSDGKSGTIEGLLLGIVGVLGLILVALFFLHFFFLPLLELRRGMDDFAAFIPTAILANTVRSNRLLTVRTRRQIDSLQGKMTGAFALGASASTFGGETHRRMQNNELEYEWQADKNKGPVVASRRRPPPADVERVPWRGTACCLRSSFQADGEASPRSDRHLSLRKKTSQGKTD